MTTLRIVYVHGIRGKPPEPEYHAEWDAVLRRNGYVTDIETRMMYWADIRLGLTPDVLREAKARAKARKAPRWSHLRPQTNSPLGYAIAFALRLLDPVIRRVMKNLLEDVYFYFYGKRDVEDIRDAILDRMGAMLDEFKPHIIIAHSWGSVIAYDYFANRGYDGEVEALITMGSPLGTTGCKNTSARRRIRKPCIAGSTSSTPWIPPPGRIAASATTSPANTASTSSATSRSRACTIKTASATHTHGMAT